MRSSEYRYFRGLRTDAERHMLQEGELSALSNARCNKLSLKTRPGYEVWRRLASVSGTQCPLLLFVVDVPAPLDAVGSDRTRNSGVTAAAGEYSDCQQLPDPT